ncbi:MAG: hypothetical protein H6760_04895 [Candidatus Nomurabacteria bacterium]|nr:MAG: hypothetical protein H6760_04895 [Candidatus Nomurabacteria bacterium]
MQKKKIDKRSLSWQLLTLLGVFLFVVVAQKSLADTAYYVDQNNVSCSDAGPGSPSVPFCSLVPTQGVVAPGDTVYIADGRYGDPLSFTVSGTEGNPIRYIAQGENVVLGVFEDLVDENFTKTPGYTNVYEIALPISDPDHRLFQTYFPDILVDDPDNDSYFTMKDADGPLGLTETDDLTLVDENEGSWMISGETIYAHAYGSRVPSTASTDFVYTYDKWQLGIGASISYLVFDGFQFHYNGEYNFVVNGTHNTFYNIKKTSGFEIRGSDNYAEGITASHEITRNAPSGSFYSGASGYGLFIRGTNNTLKDIHVFHNWNNIGVNGSNITIQSGEIHGSPNHCFQPQHNDGLTIQNLKSWNCQDGYGYISGDVTNAVFENGTVQSSILFQDLIVAAHYPNSNLTFRNMLFNDCKIITGGYGVNECSYESTVTIENSIFFCDNISNFEIQHCVAPGNLETYSSIAAYQANCGDNCMTLNNVQLIDTNHTNVIQGGKWPGETPLWDIHIPNESSVAFDAGSSLASSSIDYEGDTRPQGLRYDIGADELPVVDSGGEECTPDWQCDAWASCSNGNQTRTCHDSNSCGTESGRPSQSRSCDSYVPGRITNLRVE